MNYKIETLLENPDVQQGCARFFIDRIHAAGSNLGNYCNVEDLRPEEIEQLLYQFLRQRAAQVVRDVEAKDSFWRHW